MEESDKKPTKKTKRKRPSRRRKKKSNRADSDTAAEKQPEKARTRKKRAPQARDSTSASQDSRSSQDSARPFGDLQLSGVMLAAIEKADYTEPTPVQAGFIPRALTGIDVLGQARTGTGKTAAFTIPILEGLSPRKPSNGPQALILVPTRELAVQVRGEIDKLSYGRHVQCAALYGGKPIRAQAEKLRRGVDVVVGTPGRVIDHMGRGTLRLDGLHIVVLDEADRMLDIGFRPDIEKILRRCPKERQTLLLSATVPPTIEKLAKRYMQNPEILNFSSQDVSVDTIEQFYLTVMQENKFELLKRLLTREDPKQAIVFCRTRRGTDKVQRKLSKSFKSCECIHGDMQQTARDRVMKKFREEKLRILVATDVVGRGIDVSGVSHIINYDLPTFCDDYVHRVGRTGRMGKEGVAYSFVTPEEGPELTRIEIRINKLLERVELDGFNPTGSSMGRGGASHAGQTEGGTAADEPPPQKPKPKPMPGRRPPRRVRRGL